MERRSIAQLKGDLRDGKSSFFSTLLLVALTVALAGWLMPWLQFVFGSGWVAPLFTALVVFLPLWFVQKKWLHGAELNPDVADETVLVEHYVRQNKDTTEEPAVALLENALHLKEVTAAACMTPQEQVVSLPIYATIADLERCYAQTYRSRVLVTAQNNLHQVLGYVHVRTLLQQPTDLRSLLRPLYLVPQHTPIAALLPAFIRGRQTIAGVVDEAGQLQGVLTLRDILGELFGELDTE